MFLIKCTLDLATQNNLTIFIFFNFKSHGNRFLIFEWIWLGETESNFLFLFRKTQKFFKLLELNYFRTFQIFFFIF